MEPVDDAVHLLTSIEQHGAPAQVARARHIATALGIDPDDPTLRAALQQLHDAVMHDPYLTRG